MRGQMGLTVPDLLAIDDPFVAIECRLCPKVRQVRAGVRFGVAECERDVTGSDAGKPCLLVVLRPYRMIIGASPVADIGKAGAPAYSNSSFKMT